MINRINLILQAKNITARQFAEEIGIQPSGMSHILSGRNNPSLDFVMKVIHRYPEIDTNWLLFGKGEMYCSSSKSVKSVSKSLDSLFDEENKLLPQEENIPNLFSGIDIETKAIPNTLESSTIPCEINPHMDDQKTLESALNPVDSHTNSDSIMDSTSSIKISSQESTYEDKKLVKVVFFYSDHSFSEYHPE